jgi:HAD superfamily hydrolase (TIGR01509 family)
MSIFYENILKYDLFIFDFDGTIMDTEEFHKNSWVKALHEITNLNNIDINMNEYQKYYHTLNEETSKKYLEIKYNITDYEYIYKRKQYYYEEYIKNNNINLLNGVEDFLNFLINNNKKFIIVSNTSKIFINIFLEKHLILKKAYKIYTKELFINRKPNPECYLRIANDPEYENMKKIGFEDSLVGIHALYQVNKIVPVLIFNKDYYFINDILKNYNNIIINKNYDMYKLNNNIKNYKNEEFYKNNNFINNILLNNINEFNKNFITMNNIINDISILINNMNKNANIYLSGMGKSGYVCKKCASTWQSLSIKCSYIDLPNLPHGDFGIFNNNDILILISNNGNTDEIIYILNYIKNNLKTKIITISIIANKNSEMQKLSDFSFILDNIKEADLINMTPSTSSLIFMSILDGIAINLKKNILKDEFKIYHPAGSLGKK